MSKKNTVYDEKSIKTLDALAHIRLRTGMYVGRLGDGSHPQDGIYILLKEVVDNSVDEFILGAGDLIEGRLSPEAIVRKDDVSPDALREKGAYVMKMMQARLAGMGLTPSDLSLIHI